MLISALSDYTLDSTRDKNRGNKEGAFYTDTLGESWLIKKYPYNDFAVKEDLAGNLFRLLLNGTKHSPETQLIMKKNTDGSSTYLVGSKIRQHYVGLMEMKTESMTQYNVEENQRLINNLPIEGLEDIILVSALTREGDFIGNGNVGVDLNPEHHSVNAFRIDFDDAFSNDSIQSIANYTCFGDLLKDLHADRSLREYRLLNYAKFQQAIQRLSSIDSQTIEQLYSPYKAIFHNMIDEEKDPENKKRLCASFSRIDQSIENVKYELEKFSSIQSHQTTQFKSKFANIKRKSHDGISDNPVHLLISAHDAFFVHTKPDEMLNFSKRLLRQVISQNDVYTPEKKFLDKMKFDLNEVHTQLKSSLKYQQEEYLPYLNRMLRHEKEEYRVFAQEKIPDCERLIQYYATELEQTNIEQTLLVAYAELEKAHQLDVNTSNTANYAFVNRVMSSEAGVVLRMRRDFPGDIKETHGDKYLDRALWDDHIARGRAILSQFADDVEESESMIDVLICDHEKACQCLTALNYENQIMPYSNDFLEETIEKINHQDLDHPKVTSRY